VAATYFTYSGNDYTAGTAGATDFPLVSSAAKAISYLQPSHIHVYTSTSQGATWTELTRPAQWDFTSGGTVARLATGISSGTWVRVRRITPNDGSYVTFQSGALLTAQQLNDEASSNAYVNQETSDLLNSTMSEVLSAQQAIESAIAVIGGLAAFAQVPNVAAIPAAPVNGEAVEVADSTGIESFTPLAGLPSGFTGDSGITARIIYNAATPTWVWLGYGVKEPDSRYAKLSGAIFTGLVTTPAGSTITGYAPLNSPTFMGSVTIPAGASISGYATLASPTFTGTVTIPSGASIAGYAPLASPTFTGTVTIPAGASISGYAPLASPTFTGTVTIPAGASITDYATLNTAQAFTSTKTFASGQAYPQVPANAQTSAYTLVAADAGKHISITTGGVTVPSGVFATGDVISVYNNSTSSQTITQGASVTLRNAGTANTGNRTLAQYGVCTLLCVASNTFVISGAGLS
jgi:hypothetical protein